MIRRAGTVALALLAALAGSSGAVANAAGGIVPQPETLTAPDRRTEPVVMTGAQFPDWSAGPEVTFRPPQVPTNYSVGDSQAPLPPGLRSDCYQAQPAPDINGNVDNNHGDHNCYQASMLPFRTLPGGTGVDPGSLRGYRWTGRGFVQIPFQVDTKWIHYISNNASGFAFYSGVDQETTYTFDREGFRYTTNRPFDPGNPSTVCWAQPAGGLAAAPDPNAGLVDSDEMAFMARDSGPAAPASATLPSGILDAHEVLTVDPITGRHSYIYVMRSARAARGGGYAVESQYTAANSPYVRYRRDPNADLFVYSQSSYSDYGNAPRGPVCNPDGTPAIGQGFKHDASGHIVLDPRTYVQRRPLDRATVTTPRYRFRYDGRWVMDGIQVSPDDQGLRTADYGPNLVDRWKARAFQQSPGGDTPCCGYEEEQNNWGGSSQLMGEKAGPVRVIRVTWGADSSTNNVRTEIFYAEQVIYQDNLRVHVIPPLDGIYVQRDMAAGVVTRYSNPYRPDGVPVAGINEEAFGNFHAHVGTDGLSLDSNDTTGSILRSLGGGKPLTVGKPSDSCSTCIHGDFDEPDIAFSGPPGLLQWEELDGPKGALVERWNLKQVTPVGTPLAAIATYPYYRDDSCFDDGTGSDPGPKLHARSKDEPSTWGYDPVTGIPSSPAPPGAHPVNQRRCWNHHVDGTPYNIPGTLSYDPKKPSEGPDPAPDPRFSPQGDVRYYQGDIGTHGLHIQFIVDSDNAQLTVPVDEIDSEQREVVLHGGAGNVGESYGHSFDKPLISLVTPRIMRGVPGAPSGMAAVMPGSGAASGNPATTGMAQPVQSARRGDRRRVTFPVAPVLTAGAGIAGGSALGLAAVAVRRRRMVAAA